MTDIVSFSVGILFDLPVSPCFFSRKFIFEEQSTGGALLACIRADICVVLFQSEVCWRKHPVLSETVLRDRSCKITYAYHQNPEPRAGKYFIKCKTNTMAWRQALRRDPLWLILYDMRRISITLQTAKIEIVNWKYS